MQPPDGATERRFFTVERVAEMLSVGLDDVEALVETGELRGILLGEPPAWRIEQTALDEFLEDRYEAARRHTLWNESNLGSIADIDPRPR